MSMQITNVPMLRIQMVAAAGFAFKSQKYLYQSSTHAVLDSASSEETVRAATPQIA